MTERYEFLARCKRLHFAGIGGISMSTIAVLAKDNGCAVTGSDRSESDAVKKIREKGIPVAIGHAPENVHGADAVVYTAALDDGNPEIVEAKRLGIPLVSRGEYLGFLMSAYGSRIGVSGTHGKTTTTGMISHIFIDAGLDPTVANGAVLPEIGGAYREGSQENFIYEACEYKDSFLSFCPTDAVITNIELDHTDYFRSLEQMIASFSKAVSHARRVFVNVDNANTMKALENYGGEIVKISLRGSDADFYAENVRYVHGLGEYDLMCRGEKLCEVSLRLIGEFNIYNSLCAAAVAYTFGVPGSVIGSSLGTFTGAARRFERKAVVNGVSIYDDYAHHPSECRSTLEAVHYLGYQRVFCVFQSHTYSRTHDLLDQFEATFKAAKERGINMIFAEIYAARETDTLGVSAETLAEDTGVRSFGSFEEIAGYLAENVRSGDLVLTMGAGDVYKVGNMLIKILESKN